MTVRVDPHKCLLPECKIETTRPKYCSESHSRRARQRQVVVDEDRESTETIELRAALRRTQAALGRAKTKTEDLVDAVYKASRDAALASGPYVRVPTPVMHKTGPGASEVALLHATDWQYGKKTDSYDRAKCEQRVKLLADKVDLLTRVQRTEHPVDQAVILFGGDMLEGLNIFPGQAYEVDSTLYEQLFGVSKLMAELVRRLLANFKSVEVWAEEGNHGRIGRKGDWPRTDNTDLMAYEIAKQSLNAEILAGRLAWYPRQTWHQIIEVGTYRAMLIHGDEIKSFGGNCVTPDVRVLTRDLRWVPVGDLRVGDKLLAFDENGKPRHYADAKVISTGIAPRDVWRITFDDGTFVRCTPEHPWIVAQTDRKQGGTNRQIWMTPAEIARRLQWGGRKHTGAGVWMFTPVTPWDAGDDDYAAGLLAGAFDADGCLSKGPAHPRWPTAEFAQYPNGLLDAVKRALTLKKFSFKERRKTVRNGRRGEIANLDLGRDDTLRFLGQIRPVRLLEWWMNKVDLNALTFTRKSSAGLQRIISCEPDGIAEVCTLTSSSGTYITEFGPAHNTPAFGLLRKGTAWSSGVTETFKDIYFGHYHTPMSLTLPNGGTMFGTGSTESDNAYAAEFVAAKGKPSQRLHFIDPRKGRVTAEYKVYLDQDEE